MNHKAEPTERETDTINNFFSLRHILDTITTRANAPIAKRIPHVSIKPSSIFE